MSTRPTQLETVQQINNLIAARGHLIVVRDTLPAYYSVSKEVNDIIGKIEALLGY